MRFVGLTGGIASGKSAASRAFESHGVALIDADVVAREVVAPGSAGLAAVVELFGAGILTPAGELDRAALRQRVFAQPQERRALEEVLHPRIREKLELDARAATGPYVIVAIPLLAESGGRATYPWLQRILVVDVAECEQHARLQARDGSSTELARQMVAAQATRSQRLGLADDVIVNAGSLAELEAAVGRLDVIYRALAATG